MNTKSARPEFCLAVRKYGERFVRDESQPDGLEALPRFDELKEYLAARYSETTALVEWRGLTFDTTVFIPQNQADVPYALVGDNFFSSGADTEREKEADEDLSLWIMQELGYGEPAPFGSPTRLETEFVQPELEVWNPESGPTGKRLSWQDAGERARVVIMGDPGAGKTTLLRWLALQEAYRGGQVNLARVPAYVMMRDARETTDVLALARHALEAQFQGEAERWFDPLVESGRLLLLIDGLDEITPVTRNQIIASVLRVAREYPRVGLYIATRQWGYDWHFPGFLHIQVRPFKKEQIREWIQRRITRLNTDTADHLWKVVLADEELTELAGNPLMLEMLAGILEKTGLLPRRKADLFSRYFEVVLEDWDKQRGVKRAFDVLLREDKLEVLSTAALVTWHDKRLFFTDHEFEGWAHRSVIGSQPDEIRAILHNCGICSLEKRGDVSVWQFKHSVYRDYLAAYYLVNRPDDLWSTGALSVHDPAALALWRHACGVTTDATPLLQHIREEKNLPFHERARWLALALADGISVRENERDLAFELLQHELTSALNSIKLSFIRTEQRSWRITLESTGEETNFSFLNAITDIIYVIIGGGWAGVRGGQSILGSTVPSLVEGLSGILGQNWLLRKLINRITGVLEIRGISGPEAQKDETESASRSE